MPARSAEQTCKGLQERFRKRYVSQPRKLLHKAAQLTRLRRQENAKWEAKCIEAQSRETALRLAVAARREGWKIPIYAVTWWQRWQQDVENAGHDPDSEGARDEWNDLTKEEKAEFKPKKKRVAQVGPSHELRPDQLGSLALRRQILEDSGSDTDLVMQPYRSGDSESDE
jgi:hypothetical protein